MQRKLLIGVSAFAVLVAVASLAFAAGVSGASPSALQPKGNMRVAAVSATDAISTSSTNYVNVPGLSTTIVVPDGKVADVIIEFSAVVNSPSAQYARALVDRSVASPGPVQTYYSPGNIGASTHGFNFYQFGVGSGTHTVKMQWAGLSGQQFMSYRSMVLIVNIR